jgi:hypothetical protein
MGCRNVWGGAVATEPIKLNQLEFVHLSLNYPSYGREAAELSYCTCECDYECDYDGRTRCYCTGPVTLFVTFGRLRSRGVATEVFGGAPKVEAYGLPRARET